MNGLSAQSVGIGTTSPNSSALFEVSSENKGILVPRIALTNTGLAAPVTTPAEALMIYNTNASVAGTGALGKGFYYWTGIRWQKMIGGLEGWSLTGNGSTDTAVNFIGTTNGSALMFRVANQPAGRIEVNGENLFFGLEAGRFNIYDQGNFIGERNTFIGSGAGKSNTNGRSNTYIGAAAGRSVASSFGNTMVGAYTGASNQTGQFNTNVGFAAGGQIGDGSRNTALGYQAGSFMGDNPGSQGNVTVGFEAGVSLRNGAGNVVIGRHAGNGNFNQNGLGSYNVYIGDSSAPASNNAQQNVAIGRRSLRCISSASRNVAIGDSAGSNLITGSGNVFIGAGARGSENEHTNATAIGSRAYVTSDNVIVLGGIPGINGATQKVNVGIGTTNPLARLYIQDGPSSNLPFASNSLLVLDKTGGPNYISLLNGDFESGIIFARAGSTFPPFDAGMYYNVNTLPGAMQFRNKGGLTRLIIQDNGNISIGTTNGNHKLQIQDGTSTGVAANGNSSLVLDRAGSDHYFSILSDNARAGGILFGVAGSANANANGGIIYNAANNLNGFQFRTGGNNTKMTINSDGQVGIGTLAPQYRLHVVTNDAQNFGYREGIVVENTATGADNTGEAAISFKNAGPDGTGSNQWIVGLNQNRNLAFAYGADFAGGSITKMVIDSTGKVGIGLTNPTFQLQLSQNSAAKPTSSSWTIASDARLKKDMHQFMDGLDVLNKIDPIWFTYNGVAGLPGETGIGTTAQAMQAIAPYMVKPLGKAPEGLAGGGDILGVDYGPLQFIMVNAIKEQQGIIDAQREQIELLKARLDKLEQKK